MNVPNQNRLFVVGVGRSGTSLLQVMLASHKSIEFIPETGMVRQYVLKGKLGQIQRKYGFNEVEATVANDKRLQRINSVGELLKKLNLLSTAPYKLDCTLYNAFYSQNDSEYFGDKDPKLIEHINQLLHIWPKAKVIHIFRDPRDVLVSKKKASWAAASNYKLLVANAAQFDMAFKAQSVWKRENIHFIQYEKLVKEPKNVMVSLCDWLSLPFDEAMLNHTKNAGSLVAQDEMQWKADVFKPVVSSNFNKWKNELTTFEALCVEYSCMNAMKIGNYAGVNSASRFTKGLAYIYGASVRLSAFGYKLVRNMSNQMDYTKSRHQ